MRRSAAWTSQRILHTKENYDVSQRNISTPNHATGTGAAATVGLVSSGGAASAHAIDTGTIGQQSGIARGGSSVQTSLSNAYLFLNQMMDAYAHGATIRLCQSYCDQIAGGTFYSTGFVTTMRSSPSPISSAENRAMSAAPR